MAQNKTIILLALIIVLMTVFRFSNDDEFKNQIKELETYSNNLEIDNIKIKTISDSIFKLRIKEQKRSEKIEKQLKFYENKRYEIPSIVSDYDERKLDSILTNYKHPKRN